MVVEDIEDNPGFFRVQLFAVPHFRGRHGCEPVAGQPDAESQSIRRGIRDENISPVMGRRAFLAPQQFQQQAIWDAHMADTVARMGLAQPWGVVAAEFDDSLLALSRLTLHV